jgi:hypothetical protein
MDELTVSIDEPPLQDSNGAILAIEVLVTHDQQEYPIDETQDRRDEGPAEEQI